MATILTLVCIPVFIKLGLWQYHKAKLKQDIQATYAQSASKGALDLVNYLNRTEELEYQKASVSGQYETQYQLLIDNQVEGSQAGYHVITPLKIEGARQYVLVNRGWIPGNVKHEDAPTVETPKGVQKIEGMVWIPSKKIFTLESTQTSKMSGEKWEAVWQNLDMTKYHRVASIEVLPVIIKLDPASQAGGFVRNWQPAPDRIVTHLGYAYQWFGFAVSAVLIYLFTSFKRIKNEN